MMVSLVGEKDVDWRWMNKRGTEQSRANSLGKRIAIGQVRRGLSWSGPRPGAAIVIDVQQGGCSSRFDGVCINNVVLGGIRGPPRSL